MATRSGHCDVRLKTLAIPKSLPAGFLEDRRSIYWENNLPPKDYTKTTTFVLNARQEQLVHSKKLHPEYQGDRPSPVWSVSVAARKASASNRVAQLAQAKQLPPDYQPCRQVMTAIPSSAICVRPSGHLSRLARHKTYPPLLVKPNSEWDWGEWNTDISRTAKIAVASPRVSSLAEPKKAHQLYLPCRRVQWPVSRGSLSHMASERLNKLARAKSRSRELEDYDPRTWSVSRGALLAQATPRLSELATPLPRKCRTK